MIRGRRNLLVVEMRSGKLVFVGNVNMIRDYRTNTRKGLAIAACNHPS